MEDNFKYILNYDLHQLHVERVGVTNGHIHMCTSLLVSVAAHLTSQIIFIIPFDARKYIINISTAFVAY